MNLLHSERRFAFYMTILTIAALLLLMLTPGSTPEPGFADSRPKVEAKVGPRGVPLRPVLHAYHYASKCGGKVEVIPLYDGTSHESGPMGPVDIVVIGCDGGPAPATLFHAGTDR
jgi:hypothetical protein